MEHSAQYRSAHQKKMILHNLTKNTEKYLFSILCQFCVFRLILLQVINMLIKYQHE